MKIKRINTFVLIMSMLIVFSFWACVDQEPQEVIDEFSVEMIMPDDFGDSVFYANQTIVLKSNRISYSAITDSLGKAVFKNIIPGIYNLSTHQVLTSEISLVGDTLQYRLFKTDSLVMKLNKSIKANLIISKVYASGTKDNNNKNYVADRYVEIFNNSDTIQVLDSTFYFGLVEAESVIAYPASKNPGFVYARQVFRFIKDASKLNIQPGGSVILANSAIDHTQFSANSINLRISDFEAKNTTFSNNAEVSGLELIYSAFPALIYMNLINGGDNGAFLFRTTQNVRSFPILYMPGKEQGNRYMQIPIQYVIDGVETLKNYTTGGVRVETKRLQTYVDAGYMFITASTGYTHESIERRVDVAKSTTSRYYLIDSNNSSNDFRVVTDPTPRKYDKTLLTAK
jgi:hypothetical protein